MERPHLSAAWLALLALALTATGAPLPFPKKGDHLRCLKELEGDWVAWMVDTPARLPDDRFTASLAVAVTGDRLRLCLKGKPLREWTITPTPEKAWKSISLKLTRHAGGVTEGDGVFHPDEGQLFLRLAQEDIGLDDLPAGGEKEAAKLVFERRRK